MSDLCEVKVTHTTKRTTIYLEPELQQALRIKAAVTDRTSSALINEMVRERPAEDAEDLQALRGQAAFRTAMHEAGH